MTSGPRAAVIDSHSFAPTSQFSDSDEYSFSKIHAAALILATHTLRTVWRPGLKMTLLLRCSYAFMVFLAMPDTSRVTRQSPPHHIQTSYFAAVSHTCSMWNFGKR